MNRRNFLLAPIVFASLSVCQSAGGTHFSPLEFNLFQRLKETQLGSAQVFVAVAGQTFLMPKKPQDGDTIKFVVDGKSLLNPCRLKDDNFKIAGDPEPLVLNCLAIFSVTFDQRNGNWKVI